MARPQETRLDRLRRRLWAHALRADVERNRGQQVSWALLGRLLVEASTEAGPLVPKGWRFQGIQGVAHRGDDPHRVVMRIPADQTTIRVPSSVSLVRRRKSGRKAPDELELSNESGRGESARSDDEKITYVELPLDLVELGEKVCPGSSFWDYAPLWTIARNTLPRLEDLRVMITRLMSLLDVAAPSTEEYRPYLQAAKYQELASLPTGVRIERYRESLKLISQNPGACSISLLAILVAESFIANNEDLFELHRTAFAESVGHLFADPTLAEFNSEFDELVTLPIARATWELPVTWHVSSLCAPVIRMDEWRRITGTINWVRF
jgi:hypothetical protein